MPHPSDFLGLTRADWARIDTTTSTIRAPDGTPMGWYLERKRRWNIGLRRHANELTGRIEVRSPGGAGCFSVVSDWVSALALADRFERMARDAA